MTRVRLHNGALEPRLYSILYCTHLKINARPSLADAVVKPFNLSAESFFTDAALAYRLGSAVTY